VDTEHAEIWLQAPPPPIQNFDALVDQPGSDYRQEKAAGDDLLLLGMMLYMQQGLVLEWLHPHLGPEVEEEEPKQPQGQPHD
jgi:hypothetical protein